MKTILKLVSIAGLLLTILPAILVARGSLDLETHYGWLLIGMVFWFVSVPFWMKEQVD
ncbi:hypothetical protein HQ585_20445 [candidate division KSB1 bacterium]|nr:hypothetical protein [candidate division KSB1 bacterium]